jgi:hypothetical protein
MIRDMVDSRRSVSSWFFLIALLIVLVSASKVPAVQLIGTVLWVLLAIALVIDWWLLGRRIRDAVRDRFPNEPKRGGHVMYGIMRSTQFRRLRVPKPQVRYGKRA